MGSKQIQRAGENSQQVQAETINVYNGITEARAREIFSEMNAIARQSYTQDAYELAWKRVSMLEELLMQKVEKVNGLLEAFGDPSFQFLLTEAQKRAAASDRDADIEMLTELLVHRVKKKSERKIKASISKAVEIVDQIDDDALCALTMYHAICSFIPLTGNIKEGIALLSQLYERINPNQLPKDNLWLDNLSILGTITIVPFSVHTPYDELIKKMLDGYVCVGIDKASEEYDKAISLLVENHLPLNILVDHELLDGYVRLSINQKNAIESTTLEAQIIIDGEQQIQSRPLSDKEKQCLYDIFDLYSTDEQLKNIVLKKLMDLSNSYEAMNKAITWWNSLSINFRPNSIGRVIAHTNAKRIDNTLPDLD